MKRSPRGFLQGNRIAGRYGGTVRVYESSGEVPAVWLNVEVPEPNSPDGPIVDNATILLTLSRVKELECQLKYLRKNHFLSGDDDG